MSTTAAGSGWGVIGRDLRVLPKAELHLHLHGAMRPSTLVDLSAAAGLRAPDPRAFADFAGFQVIYRAARTCVTRPEYLRRLGLARFAARHAGRGVHAFGLAGDEAVFPTEPFAPAFAIARDAGLTAAPHAGEMAGPGSVRAAVHLLGARRIAHGIRAVEDPSTVELLREFRVSLDICPTSNVALGIVPSLSEHPLPALLDAAVACTLGADDPLLFGTGLLGEYQLARTGLGLSDEQLAALARTSITTSGAPPELISSASQGIDDWLADTTTSPHADC